MKPGKRYSLQDDGPGLTSSAEDEGYKLPALLSEYNDQCLDTVVNMKAALSDTQTMFTGSRVSYYRLVSLNSILDELDNASQRRGSCVPDGRQDLFVERNNRRTLDRLRRGSTTTSTTTTTTTTTRLAQTGSRSGLKRLSLMSDTILTTHPEDRRLSLNIRSTSSVNERPGTSDRRQSAKSSRKCIYSLAKLVGKGPSVTASTEKCDLPTRRLSSSQLTAGTGLRVLLNRHQLKGGHRLAIIGSLLAARKRLSLADHVIVQFDAKMVWRRVQMWVRILSVLKQMHQQAIDRVTQEPSSPFYMMQLSEKDVPTGGIDRNHYMFFDPTEFKANKQMRICQQVKRVLSLPSDERTPEDIHCAMIGLRAITTIAEYPVRMQRYLAQFGFFQSFEAKRAIVRQDRPPEAFYYVLYGRVLVAVKDETTGRTEIKCYLHRGHAFGELSIIRHTNRQSTVITKNYTELLCLPSEIFEKYFMVGGVKNINDPDQVHFISSLSFLRGWPLELILEDPGQANVSFGYFKRGSILCRDSNQSEWLFVVKSGSLSVYKKLVKAKPTASKKTGLLLCDGSDTSILNFLDNGRDCTSRMLESSQLMSPTTPLSRSSHTNTFDDHQYNEYEVDHDDASARTSSPVPLPPASNRPHTSIGRYQSLSPNGGRLVASPTRSPLGKLIKARNTIPDFKADGLLFKRQKTDLRQSKSKQRNRAVSHDLSPEDVLELDDKRTFLDDLDSAYCSRTHPITEADIHPEFVDVQTLTKGDVFGLAQCLFHDQPSLSVVSNGADCILINKKLFLDHCDTDLLRRLRVEVSPYPCEDKLQQDLITRVNWDVYKGALRKEIYRTSYRDFARWP